jgi:NADH-quinone oxidoreductase subunit L
VNASLLWLIPCLPLLGAILIGLGNRKLSRKVAGSMASGFVGLSALLSFATLAKVIASHEAVSQTAYKWMEVGPLSVDIGFRVDPLAAVMICVVTGVGFLIHVYSIGYMDEDKDAASCWRFFAYLNLFIFSMLLLVMGDNFLLMFVGWEGVGMCSYLLIGFWFENAAFAAAGKKAFITNRVGDFSFVLGLFWLFWALGDDATVNFVQLQETLAANPLLLGGVGSFAVTGICLLFFGGATGKSAQIPLFVWLPDAMAGPTPVSALIHAATMVTSGIYMICRLSFLFSMSPIAMGLIATIGALTALFAASIAMTQNDIKKVLAYSTVSQLGYMFLGVGIGAYTAGFFHVLTHAFFKALLFLGAGAIIHALHHEQDMRKMGGLRKHMKGTYWCFVAAYLAIIGVPGFSGFFSKDEILWLTFATPPEQIALFGEGFPLPTILWGIGVLTAAMTAFYMSRMMFMTFAGEFRGQHAPHAAPKLMLLPLCVLGLLSVFGGLLNLPHWLHMPAIEGKLHHFLEPVFAGANVRFDGASSSLEIPLMVGTLVLIAASVGWAYLLYVKSPAKAEAMAASFSGLHRGSQNKWYIDELYEAAIIGPILKLSSEVLHKIVDVRIIDGMVNGAGWLARSLGRLYGAFVQVGHVQAYALAIAIGTAVMVLCYTVGA